jgi:hypothetical protein
MPKFKQMNFLIDESQIKIMLLLSKQIVREKLQHLESEEMNKNLIESYNNILLEYADYSV